MEEIKIFSNTEFGEIRTTTINNEVWFVGKDVAKVLGYENQNRDIIRHVDDEDRIMLDSKTQYQNGIELGQRGGWLINESGLYALILSSKLPSAKRFKHWVTNEVLPSIRKNGGYIAGQENMEDDELLAKALLVAQNKIAEREKRIAEQQEHIERMKPKEIFADAVSASEMSILVGELAKMISQNGYKIVQNRLFAWLRDNGYLMKGGSSKNMPTQKSMEQKLFEIKETTINNPDGSIRISRTPKVTGKGQIFFVNKFKSNTAEAQ